MSKDTLPTSAETFEKLQDALGERSPLGVAGDIDAHVRAVVREMLAENAAPEDPAVTTFFDFGDGKGPVPARKHPNGGGWVADTAKVADTAYVGPDARVFGNAQVLGYAQLFGHTRVMK